MTDKKIDSLKHANAKRTRIPSQEEAGCEQESPEARKNEATWQYAIRRHSPQWLQKQNK